LVRQLASALSAIRIGHPWPLGASCTTTGTNFSVVAPLATRVELLLFRQRRGREPRRVIGLDRRHRSGDHWHVEVEGVGIGCCYGYRVYGPLLPGGHGFNPSKVLVDPCARAIAGWEVYERTAAIGAIPNTSPLSEGGGDRTGPVRFRTRPPAPAPLASERDL
jgi:isoamylase